MSDFRIFSILLTIIGLVIVGLVNLGLCIAVFLKSPRWTGPLPLAAGGIAVFDTVMRNSVFDGRAQTMFLALELVELCALATLLQLALRRGPKR
ncbi:hypothetical protein ACFU6S_30935 [Streptomyces sp. NPDC057456]|uniref:hypothetical protein n=1 Tax=Streptomyces sp. NPDC057456 TaxID=3346139 RepID=UPI0036B6CDE1